MRSNHLLDREVAEADARRKAPWTAAEYEAVRRAATALVRSHGSVDLPNGGIATTVDGRLFWALMAALDREEEGT